MTKKKLKLRGKILEKLSKKKKAKMQKTLDTMQKVREDDSRNLRDLANAKLKWAKVEREKGIKAIEMFKTNINQLSQKVLKLNGAIAVLEELVVEVRKSVKSND